MRVCTRSQEQIQEHAKLRLDVRILYMAGRDYSN
jgi:hypothetical protein